MESGEPVKVNFHPSCLLTIGDCLAFSRELSAAQPWHQDPSCTVEAEGQAAGGGMTHLAAAGNPSGGGALERQPTPLGEQQGLQRVPSASRVLSLGGAPADGGHPQQLGGAAGRRSRAPSPLYRVRSGVSFAADGAPLRRGGAAASQADDGAAGADDTGVVLSGGDGGPQVAVQQSVMLREAPPSMPEQMALGSCITSRVPQRYLIQNLTGSNIWYWAPTGEEDDAARVRPGGRKVFLAAHRSEELKVSPVPQQVVLAAADGTVISEGRQHVICLQLEGRWMPLENVSVDVVGKYRYAAWDPSGEEALPVRWLVAWLLGCLVAWLLGCLVAWLLGCLVARWVGECLCPASFTRMSTPTANSHHTRLSPPTQVLLDVLLVGRTKILKLHGPLWATNATRHKLGLTLVMPAAANGAPVVLGPGDSLDSHQNMRLRPLKPGEGRFLPLVATLGGALFLEPLGCAAGRGGNGWPD